MRVGTSMFLIIYSDVLQLGLTCVSVGCWTSHLLTPYSRLLQYRNSIKLIDSPHPLPSFFCYSSDDEQLSEHVYRDLEMNAQQATTTEGVAAHGICFSYGAGRKKNTVLRNLSLHLPRGKIYGLLGPSGCGKTTSVMEAFLRGRLRPAC